MSIRAIVHAFEQDIKPATAKFVLVAFADCVSDYDGCGYPSITTICAKTSLDRKTVMGAVARLQKDGHLLDTGRRKGWNQRVRVFKLLGFKCEAEASDLKEIHPKHRARAAKSAPAKPQPAEAPGWGELAYPNGTENGTIMADDNGTENGTIAGGDGTENGIIPNFPFDSPENGTQNRKGTVNNNNNNSEGAGASPGDEDSEDAEAVLAKAAEAKRLAEEAAAAAAAAKAKKPKPPEVTWDGANFTIPDEFLAEWKDSYPLINVDLVIKQARSWRISNPKKKYTNQASFLNNWLARKQGEAEVDAKAAEAKAGGLGEAPRSGGRRMPPPLPKHTGPVVSKL